jgi:hypothetical protein
MKLGDPCDIINLFPAVTRSVIIENETSNESSLVSPSPPPALSYKDNVLDVIDEGECNESDTTTNSPVGRSFAKHVEGVKKRQKELRQLAYAAAKRRKDAYKASPQFQQKLAQMKEIHKARAQKFKAEKKGNLNGISRRPSPLDIKNQRDQKLLAMVRPALTLISSPDQLSDQASNQSLEFSAD